MSVNIPESVLTLNKNPLVTSGGYKIVFDRAPNVTFFAQAVNIPGISVNEVAIARPQINAYVPGDKLIYEPLTLTVLLTEDLDNYKEIYTWLYQSVMENNSSKQYSDITIFSLTSKNNPNKEVVFKNAFPVSLGAVNFTVQETDTVYGQVDMTFRYDYFTFD